MKGKRGAEWSKEYDASYDAYYFFNKVSGESEWVSNDDDGDGDGGSFAEIELTAREEKGKGKGKEWRAEGEDGEDEDEEDEMVLIPESARVFAETEVAMMLQKRCLFVNACLCECPLAILEGVVRGALFTGLGMALLVVAACTCDQLWLLHAKQCAREAILTLAAVLSLLIPFMACVVYRRYDDEEDWDLSPLPTLLGWVDTQRFMAFSFFGGSNAQHRGRNEAYPEVIFDFHDEHSQDSWKEGILLSPRKVFYTLTKISRGRFEH